MKTKNTWLDPDVYADNALENIQKINLEICSKKNLETVHNRSIEENEKKEREKINNVLTI